MSIVESGFWPKDIKPRILTPVAILRACANELHEKTNGVLISEVSTNNIDHQGPATLHSLDIVVPALRNFRQRLLSIRHRPNEVYPAYVDSPGIEDWPRYPERAENEALTDDELVSIIKKGLSSDQVRSTLASLIAMATQVLEGGAEVDPNYRPSGNGGAP